jgi:hypothetical protein
MFKVNRVAQKEKQKTSKLGAPKGTRKKKKKKQGAYLCNLHVVYCPIDLE